MPSDTISQVPRLEENSRPTLSKSCGNSLHPFIAEIQARLAPPAAPAPLRCDARKFGAVVLRFRYPNSQDFHINLCELKDSRIQHLLALLAKLLGVPVLLPPSSAFAAAFREPRKENPCS